MRQKYPFATTCSGHNGFSVKLVPFKEVGEAWRAVMGQSYPVMAAIEVSGFMEDHAKLEIEATAVVPEG